ncbi:caveolin-2 [Chanos chanos]|uniref:Caveolin n=1 Tax=Chanos chanos TaxID=29144 RepID=A0A6J2UX53_CHACN|nr:caveolin-2-like [Chanos chanos]
MMSDEYLVECKIDDDDEEEQKLQHSPPPPPQFSTPSITPQPSLTHVESRDPYGVNKHLKVEFSDVLAEPMSVHSYDRVWVYSGISFESARIWGYRCLTVLCAVPVSLLSGCLFALLACLHIWCVMPCIQVCHTCLPCVRSLWMTVVNIFIEPFCASVARCCSGIYILLSKEED